MKIVLTLAACLILMSCSMEGITEPSKSPPVIHQLYLPFVQAASVPDEISQWSNAEIGLDLVAKQPSDVLRGIALDYIGGSNLVVVSGNDIWIHPWIYDPTMSGTIVRNVPVSIPDLAAGDYTVHIQTADSLEDSAIHVQIEGNLFLAPEPPGTHYLEFPLTVLPAEEAAP